jgi:glycerol kinase
LESTALGAAYLAGLATGHFKNLNEISAAWTPDKRFEPRMDVSARRTLIAGWRKAVRRALSPQPDV